MNSKIAEFKFCESFDFLTMLEKMLKILLIDEKRNIVMSTAKRLVTCVNVTGFRRWSYIFNICPGRCGTLKNPHSQWLWLPSTYQNLQPLTGTCNDDVSYEWKNLVYDEKPIQRKSLFMIKNTWLVYYITDK